LMPEAEVGGAAVEAEGAVVAVVGVDAVVVARDHRWATSAAAAGDHRRAMREADNARRARRLHGQTHKGPRWVKLRDPTSHRAHPAAASIHRVVGQTRPDPRQGRERRAAWRIDLPCALPVT
jgi:hypothetical protein